MSFNSHSIAERIGWDTTWQRYTHGQKDGMRTNGHGKLDLHHSFLKCCRPQIHPYYILDNILMEIVNDLALKTP